jgi:murein DD-endopeptidase MepM/ murein hydrolase activator NlpD
MSNRNENPNQTQEATILQEAIHGTPLLFKHGGNVHEMIIHDGFITCRGQSQEQIKSILDANNITMEDIFLTLKSDTMNNSGQLPSISVTEKAFPPLDRAATIQEDQRDYSKPIGVKTFIQEPTQKDDWEVQTPISEIDPWIASEQEKSTYRAEELARAELREIRKTVLQIDAQSRPSGVISWSVNQLGRGVKSVESIFTEKEKREVATIVLPVLSLLGLTVVNGVLINKEKIISNKDVIVLVDTFVHPMKDGARYNSPKVDKRTITINGVTRTKPHRGIDSALSTNEIRYIRASRSGVITNICTNSRGSCGGYGTLIEVDTIQSSTGTFDGLGFRNAHLEISEKWKVGSRINQGDIIGKMANNGHGTGSHDHFEILDRSNDIVTIANLKTKLKGANAQMGKKIGQGKIGNTNYSVWHPTNAQLDIKLHNLVPEPRQHLDPCDLLVGGCPNLKSNFAKPVYINSKTLAQYSNLAKK